MHCDGCVRSVTGAVRELDDRATVQADLQTRQVRVETTASDEAVAAAIREAGFAVEG
jgi:copper chaperone